ncbi:MAG: hypothetical protein KatS3mg111_2903 [Pirellulaceae bacterium]|nr:MAG: hypothetical protein KatS3mg111_2903 [Pirellulaceae bacterium]
MKNRIPSSARHWLDSPAVHLADSHAERGAQESSFEHQLCLFGPERYEARYRYPLVVWLHSCGSSEFELESIMPVLSMQNYVACAPRGTSACDPDGKLYRWNHSAAACAIAEEIVFEAIEVAQKQFSVDPAKVFLAGFGGGGTMAWRIALRYPQRFAGMVSICGEFPASQQPLLHLHAARQLPMLWQFGSQSTKCGIQQICEALPILHSAGLNVDIRQYPCGTELLSNMLTDLNRWLMEQVTQQASVAVPTVATPHFSQN